MSGQLANTPPAVGPPGYGRGVSDLRRREALRQFKTAIAYGGKRSAATFALARAGEQGESLTVPEATAHTDVHQTTLRRTLGRLEELGLVEETSKAGRMAFRFTQLGMTGYCAWQAEQEEDRAEAARMPPASAMYRWRVKGFASRPIAVDGAELAGQLSDAGLELVDASTQAEQLAELSYEVDAADELDAQHAARRAGWSMQGLLSSAERIGLASQLHLREGHALELRADLTSVIAAVEADIARRVHVLRRMRDVQRHVANFQARRRRCSTFSATSTPKPASASSCPTTSA